MNLLNKSGGRAASIWTGNATVGQKVGQWVDDSAAGTWRLVETDDQYFKFQAVKNPKLYLTGASKDTALTVQNSVLDGSQEWRLVKKTPPKASKTATTTPQADPIQNRQAESPKDPILVGNRTPGGMPMTGSPIVVLGGLGATMSVSGVVVAVVARRRRTRFASAESDGGI